MWALIRVTAYGRQCFGTDSNLERAQAWALKHDGEVEPAK